MSLPIGPLIRSYQVIVRHMIDNGGIDFRFEQLAWDRQNRDRTIISWVGAVILFENRGHPCKFPTLVRSFVVDAPSEKAREVRAHCMTG